MKKFVNSISSRKAALTTGVAFIISVVIVTLVDDFLIANLVVPGDTVALANDIKINHIGFGYAVIGYLLVLVLDAIIGVGLYIVLKPANKKLAALVASLRLIYTIVLVIGLISLAVQLVDTNVYSTIKLVGYVFFALHIFMLGYSILKSNYIPNLLGVLLILASFTYVVFFVDFDFHQALMVFLMLMMLIGELSLSIWLIVKRKKIPE